jgi:hypothetical protein
VSENELGRELQPTSMKEKIIVFFEPREDNATGLKNRAFTINRKTQVVGNSMRLEH